MANKKINLSDIIDATIALVNEKPVEKISVNDICGKAGIAKSTFYSYFNTKEELFASLFSSLEESSLENIPTILLSLSSPLEQFWALMLFSVNRAYNAGAKITEYAIIQQHKRSQHYAYSEDSYYSSPVIHTLIELIRKAQQCNEIRNLSDPKLLFRCICSFMEGIDLKRSYSVTPMDYKKEVFQGIMCILDAQKEVDMNLTVPRI